MPGAWFLSRSTGYVTARAFIQNPDKRLVAKLNLESQRLDLEAAASRVALYFFFFRRCFSGME